MGMPSFEKYLNQQDVNDIHVYLIDKANEDHELRHLPTWLLALKKAWYEILAWFIGIFLSASSASA